MQVKKVLVQWLPSPQLRKSRFLTLGAKWATDVQQYKITIEQPEFAEAFVLASPRDGAYLLQVGFTGSPSYREGWTLGNVTPEGAVLWDLEPTAAEAVACARERLVADLEAHMRAVGLMEAQIAHLVAVDTERRQAELDRFLAGDPAKDLESSESVAED